MNDTIRFRSQINGLIVHNELSEQETMNDNIRFRSQIKGLIVHNEASLFTNTPRPPVGIFLC